jgi:3-phenylpropionate/trans-cinnamate dioxygenase ferredoxin reductase subunit
LPANPYIVIGAGQAGMQICDSLRKFGYAGELVLLGEEAVLPYQRPPLSKKFLGGELAPERLLFRPPSYYEKIAVDVRLGACVVSIDRGRQSVNLADGSLLRYDKLALATGTRVRPLTCPGSDCDGIYYVRTLEDSERLLARLATVSRMTVIGGGFIGLEVAAMACALGKTVCVIEAQERLMARAVSPKVSEFYAGLHRSHGVDVRLACGVEEITNNAHGLEITLDDGQALTSDIIIAGIGVLPNVELAESCGLVCRNGIVVDGQAQTSDPDIVAAGDCTMHYNGFLQREIRLESVQNAVDQAKVAAATLCGEIQTYRQVPWFWSDQYDVKLQMAGIGMPFDTLALRGDVGAAAFSIFYFRDGVLAGADSVNRPAEHMACRKLLAQGTMVSVEQAGDEGVDLKQLATTDKQASNDRATRG